MKALAVFLGIFLPLAHAAPPVISNIRVSQRPGTKLVDIYYDLADADGDVQLIQVAASSDAGLTYTIPCVTLSGSVGANVALGANRHIVWNAGTDWNGNWVSQCRVRVTAHDGTTPPAPPGMANIPGGPFQMGDNFNELEPHTRPIRNVEISAFFIDKTEVTRELWEQVKAWGNANGYSIIGGQWKDVAHPVHSVSWFNAVKWCNARSEREGLIPCYYTDEAQTVVYKSGNTGLSNSMVKWSANGYRLPTEAEWEKAARGGRTGQRYIWGNTIGTSEANYNFDGNPWLQPFLVDGTAASSPVSTFSANDFGLFDMAGNVSEWCWDWWGHTYYGTPESVFSDPLGPTQSSSGDRVSRGGSWGHGVEGIAVAYRSGHSPHQTNMSNGFRTVRR